MSKTSILFILFIISFSAALAQKADTLKVDTTLNKYQLSPRKNSLPVRTRQIQIKQEEIPTQMPDYKVSYWKKSLIFGLNFSQSAFSNNWSAGGISSVALGSNFNFKAEYNKAPFSYTSELNLLYGIAANKGQGERKTNDRIFLDNKVASQISKHWFFFGSLSFESQFSKGFQYSSTAQPVLISNFMSPGYLTESIGFEYKPVKYFDLRLGTGTAKQTFVLDTTIYHNLSSNYGVKPRHTFKDELAFQVVAALDKDLMQNIHINARYALFIPYQQGLAYTTHRLDATLTAKVNRLINVTMNGTFLYDKNTSPKPQATEGLALGVSYKFP